MLRTNILTVALCLLVGAGCGSDPGSTGNGGSGGIDGSGGTGGVGGTGAGGGTGGTGGTGGSVPVPVCGDSVIEGDEACDDGEANSDNAADACRTDCTEARCGDGVEDTGEACDDGNLADGDGCSASCRLEFTCGDGIREFTEECDGADLAGQSCADYGHNAGNLACATDCTFDSSACTTVEICDNGVDDDGNGETDCEDDACTSDIIACPSCGDGVINVDGEECDGADLPSCADLDFDGGTTSCTDTCTVDSSACVMHEDCTTPGDEDGNGFSDCDDPACSEMFECPSCGNGIIQQGEQCEGVAPPQANCLDNGFDTGTMSCDPVTCQISTANCRDFVCGDGNLEGTEECDDGNSVAGDGCTSCMVDGETCANPLLITDATHRDPVTGVWTFTGDTSTLTNTFAAPSCNSGNAEPEAVVKFTATSTGEYSIEMITTGVFDDLFFVWDGACGDGSPEVACIDGGAKTLTLSAGQDIYIIATGWGALDDDSGPFTLTVTPISVCGDGVVEGHETCDLSDTTPGDGCSEFCIVEQGWACDSTSCHQTICGDGLQQGYEWCDDGNTVPNDGCTNCMVDGDSCSPAANLNSMWNATANQWVWTGDSTPYVDDFPSNPTCGSSVNQPDAVAAFRPTVAGNYYVTFTSGFDVIFWAQGTACGSGGTEIACADNAWDSTGGTEAFALPLIANETVYFVAGGYGTGTSSVMSGPFTMAVSEIVCGNSVVEPGEFCDDGNSADGDGCSSTCQLEGVIPEVEPNESIADAVPFPVGSIGMGSINGLSDFYDSWAIDVVAGTTYEVFTSSAADGTCGFQDSTCDTAIGIWDDVAATYVATNNDINADNWCSSLTFTPTRSGLFYIDVEMGFWDPIPLYFLWFDVL